MPYAKNQLAVSCAKIKSIETRYTRDNKQITNINCFEYQGSKDDKPEGIYWSLELWEKTSEFFLKNQPQEGDYLSFMGSVIDKSFTGNDGKTVYRQGVKVNQIELLRPRDNQNQNQPQSHQQPRRQSQPTPQYDDIPY